jgi:hypothetical protein
MANRGVRRAPRASRCASIASRTRSDDPNHAGAGCVAADGRGHGRALAGAARDPRRRRRGRGMGRRPGRVGGPLRVLRAGRPGAPAPRGGAGGGLVAAAGHVHPHEPGAWQERGRPLPDAAGSLGREGAAVLLRVLPDAGRARRAVLPSVPGGDDEPPPGYRGLGRRGRARLAGGGGGGGVGGPPARAVPRGTRQPRQDLPNRAVAHLPPPQLLLRVGALVVIRAARGRLAVVGAHARRPGADGVLPLQGDRHPGHRGAGDRLPG